MDCPMANLPTDYATIYPQLTEILVLSLRVTLTAVVAATIVGLMIGGALAVHEFPGRRAAIVILVCLR